MKNASDVSKGGVLMVTPPGASDALQGSNIIYNLQADDSITLTLDSNKVQNVTIVETTLWVFRADAIKVEPLDEDSQIVVDEVRHLKMYFPSLTLF